MSPFETRLDAKSPKSSPSWHMQCVDETEIIALISKFQKRTLLNRGTMYRAPHLLPTMVPSCSFFKKDLKKIIVLKVGFN